LNFLSTGGITNSLLADSDSDGFDDFSESLWGSNPSDPASTPSSEQVPALTASGFWLLVGLLGFLGAMHLSRAKQKCVPSRSPGA